MALHVGLVLPVAPALLIFLSFHVGLVLPIGMALLALPRRRPRLGRALLPAWLPVPPGGVSSAARAAGVPGADLRGVPALSDGHVAPRLAAAGLAALSPGLRLSGLLALLLALSLLALLTPTLSTLPVLALLAAVTS